MGTSSKLGLKSKARISQSIINLLSTVKGEVPFRPNFGISLEKLLDGNSDLKIAAEIIQQIEIYVPAIKVKNCIVSANSTGNLTVKLIYKILKTKQSDTIAVTL